MTSRKTPLLALLAFLYFAPGLFFFSFARGETPRWSATLTTAGEPGEALQVTGTVYGSDGETPVAGAVLYVYHTDAEGYYSPGTTDNSNPRLKATLETDGRGRYEFRTIRPAPYPGGGVAAHVHYKVSGTSYPDQSFTLHFEGDPELSSWEVERSQRAGKFGNVRPVTRGDDGVLRVTFDLRLR